MKKIYALACAGILAIAANAQSFTNSSDLLPGAYHSGGCTGVVDMDSDGYDDIVVLNESLDLYVLYQSANGDFTMADYGTVSDAEQWGMCVADVDNDGHLDVFSGGYYDGGHLVNINGPGDFEHILLEDDYTIFMQGVNFADINNDGWLDLFACHDDGEPHIWGNNGEGLPVPHNEWMNRTFYPEVGGNDNSGNYGSAWTDFDRDGDLDLFIAKCRQFISDPYDFRRTNVLMVNDGENNYSNKTFERGLVNYQQSWTSDFVDSDNDGDWDCFLTTHSATLQLHENDGSGYFTDITEGSGLEVSGFFLQAKFADFDNDGWIDLIHSGGDHGYYHNNGDNTFTLIANVFPGTDTMHSFGIGDLNKDGWLDVYASYGNGYVEADNAHSDRLWINNGGDNNFIVFDLEGTVSNKDAVGATVEIHGDFGVKIREVRGGESYGITNCSSTHFGLGEFDQVEMAIVYWPSGLVTVIENPAINTWNNVMEEECSGVTATISANGSANICPGGSVTLEVDNTNGDFVWSNGATTNSITVSTGGSYHIIAWDGDCATASNHIEVLLVQDPIPAITVDGETEFCEGVSVQLIATTGQSYTWSNGATSQAITVDEAGIYSVSVMGQCEELDSPTVELTVFSAPDAPVVEGVTLPEAGAATLTSTGSNVRWFDSADGVTAVGVGNSYNTPWLETTTSFWAEDVTIHGGDLGNGGKLENESSPYGQYHNSSTYYLIFDAIEDMYLENVKVFANGEDERTIQVTNSLGDEIAVGTFLIPDGESVVTLDFFVPAGTDYALKCTSGDPQLWRDKNLDESAPFGFPYDIDGIATITHTSVGGGDSDNYYYFFYDWNVTSATFECASPRTEATVTLVGIGELDFVNQINLYPNPAHGKLNIEFEMTRVADLDVHFINALGEIVNTKHFASNSIGNNNKTISLENMAAGIYEVRFIANGNTTSRKIVIE